MSRFMDAARQAERTRTRPPTAILSGPSPARRPRPYRVLSVVSNKGGVGKTTIASNLAVYLRAQRDDLPVLVLSLDDQTGLDRMFGLDGSGSGETLVDGLRALNLGAAIRLGRYGVHYVPPGSDVADLKREIVGLSSLDTALRRSGWEGLVVIDTKSDLEILTRNAIAASDLVLTVVKDQASFLEAEKVYAILSASGRPREEAWIVLSMIDLRIKYATDGAQRDILTLLLTRIRERGYPVLPSFLSYSPKIESLHTNPDGDALPILHHAEGSLVHRQMLHLAEDVLKRLDASPCLERSAPTTKPRPDSDLKSQLLHGSRPPDRPAPPESSETRYSSRPPA
jgi:chromosome partitioning protein